MRRPKHTHHVLLGNKTLNEALRVLLFEYLREGGVLGVTVQHNDSIICMAQLSQSQTTCLPSSYLEESNSRVSQNAFRKVKLCRITNCHLSK